MDLFHNLGIGLVAAVSLQNLVYCFVGVFLGTAIGVLPGLGPLATISMLLPATYALGPLPALIMLAGIYYGAQYGGSTTAILVNLPGESASVVTCLDGHQMARRGRAGAALAVAALSSFAAGTVATLVIAAFGPSLSELAFNFGPAEYFALMLFGLMAAIALASGSFLKALAMVVLGLVLGTVGIDVNSGEQRFTFGIPYLLDGIEFVAIAMGLFAFTDIILGARRETDRSLVAAAVTSLMPNKAEWRAAWPAALRGTTIGCLLGLLPGVGGASLSSFTAYTVEKKLSKTPARFGQGAVEGVAGPEAANNAGAQTAFIPMLTLGLPTNGVMALMIGAMMIHDIVPGPEVMNTRPDLFWGLIVSMWIGNVILLVLNLPLISLWVRMLKVPFRVLYPVILVFCCIGLYAIQNRPFEIYLGAVFAAVGYLLYSLRCEPAPLLLGFVLGPMMEENLRRALVLSRGDFSTFVTRPVSLSLLCIAFVIAAFMVLPAIRRKKDRVFAEETQ
jgi:putative tricarboxylic transport membrane protein